MSLDGTQVGYAAYEYFMLNKPAGVVSATEDGRHKTVVSLIEDAKRRDLFPVGRLDIDTEGLLLITNDGKLAHRLLSPKKHVDKTYFARVEGRLPENAIEQFKEGLTLEDGTRTLPARLVIQKASGTAEDDGKADSSLSEIELTIHEGKFHQVKRMMEETGCPVLHLKRLSMGPLKLDDTLKTGEYRKLTDKERELLENL